MEVPACVVRGACKLLRRSGGACVVDLCSSCRFPIALLGRDRYRSLCCFGAAVKVASDIVVVGWCEMVLIVRWFAISWEFTAIHRSGELWYTRRSLFRIWVVCVQVICSYVTSSLGGTCSSKRVVANVCSADLTFVPRDRALSLAWACAHNLLQLICELQCGELIPIAMRRGFHRKREYRSLAPTSCKNGQQCLVVRH